MRLSQKESIKKYKIVKFHKEHMCTIKNFKHDFKLPDIKSPLIVVRISVSDEKGNIIGCAFLKIIGEVILSLDNELESNDKAEILSLLNDVGCIAARNKGFDEINIFVNKDKSFSQFLEKKLGYIKSKDEVLVKRV